MSAHLILHPQDLHFVEELGLHCVRHQANLLQKLEWQLEHFEKLLLELFHDVLFLNNDLLDIFLVHVLLYLIVFLIPYFEPRYSKICDNLLQILQVADWSGAQSHNSEAYLKVLEQLYYLVVSVVPCRFVSLVDY